ELYLVPLEPGWLGQGAYHYDRQGHCLARVVAEAPRPRWADLVPSLGLVEGGALLWVLVGDVGRVRRKYGERSLRFLLQESGHLMQTLCLASASLGLATVPMGGYLERAVACGCLAVVRRWCRSSSLLPAPLSRSRDGAAGSFDMMSLRGTKVVLVSTITGREAEDLRGRRRRGRGLLGRRGPEWWKDQAG